MENELSDANADSEKPRYLLPDGCKNLADWVWFQEQEVAKAAQPPPQAAPKRPSQISISEPVQVRELAMRLQVKTYRVVHALIPLKIFVTSDSWISLAAAATVGARFGVCVIKAGPNGPAN